MEILQLAQQNPWWENEEAILSDRDLRRLRSQKILWVPRLQFRLLERLDADRVYTLRGPRQVGKTTLLKSLVRILIQEKGKDARSIFYYSFDLARSPEEVAEIVETYLEWQAPFELERRYMLLDEISSVKEWGLGIRSLANRGLLDDSTLVLTGSHAMDVANQVERLPGRRGEGNQKAKGGPLDQILLPMKFAEYAGTSDPRIRKTIETHGLLRPETRRIVLEGLLSGRESAEWSSLLLVQRRATRLLRDYLVTGGFPRTLNEFRQNTAIPRETYDLYVRAVTGDLSRYGLDDRTAREVVVAIIDKLGTPVSLRSLADDTALGSHNTVARYLEAMEQSYIVQSVYSYDRSRRRRFPKKNRKLYIGDPFMFHALRSWALAIQDPYVEAQKYAADSGRSAPLLEAVVADHLARFAYAANPSPMFAAYDHVFYWHTKRGWEVDFIVKDSQRPLAFQLTTSRARPETRRALSAFGGGATLTIPGTGDSIPLACFLLLI